MSFLGFRYNLIKILAVFFFVLTALTNSASAQSSLKLGGSASYKMRVGKGWVIAEAQIAQIDNWDVTLRSPSLSVQLWLSRKKYKIGSRTPIVGIAKRTLGTLNPDSYFSNISFNSGGARRVKKGKYFVTIALLDSRATQVFDAITFRKSITVR